MSWLIIVAGALPWEWGSDGDPWPALEHPALRRPGHPKR